MIVQPSGNGSLPIAVTLDGIVIVAREEHSLNTWLPILLTLEGIVTDFKEEHS